MQSAYSGIYTTKKKLSEKKYIKYNIKPILFWRQAPGLSYVLNRGKFFRHRFWAAFFSSILQKCFNFNREKEIWYQITTSLFYSPKRFNLKKKIQYIDFLGHWDYSTLGFLKIMIPILVYIYILGYGRLPDIVQVRDRHCPVNPPSWVYKAIGLYTSVDGPLLSEFIPTSVPGDIQIKKKTILYTLCFFF